MKIYWDRRQIPGGPTWHEQWYTLTLKYQGHQKLVAQELGIPVTKCEHHLHAFRRNKQDLCHAMWGSPDLRDEPEKTACWYCVAFDKEGCTAGSTGALKLDANTCLNAPLCPTCKGVCVDDKGEPTACQTICKHCGKIGHVNSHSKLCAMKSQHKCKTCGTQGCNGRICLLPKKKTTDENAIRVLENAKCHVPETAEDRMEAAQGLVALVMQTKGDKDRKDAVKLEKEADQVAEATVVYSKMYEFIDFCVQSQDPSLQPPPTTHKTLPAINAHKQQFYIKLYQRLRAESKKDAGNAYARFQRIRATPKRQVKHQQRALWKRVTKHKAKLKVQMKSIKKQQKSQRKLLKASHPVEQVYRTNVHEGRSTDKLVLAKKDYKKTKTNLAEIETKLPKLEPPTIITKESAVAGVPPKEENVIRVSRYHMVDETVRLWNGFLSRNETFGPAGETAEQREEREAAMYLHARHEKLERRYNNSYNPKYQTQNFVYPSAGDSKVDPARPIAMKQKAMRAFPFINTPKPAKAKPAPMSFDTIKRLRLKRRADMTWIKDSILTDDQLVKENAKLEFLEISPEHKDELHAKHKTSFEKDQAKYDKLFEYEAQKVVKGVPRIPKALRPHPMYCEWLNGYVCAINDRKPGAAFLDPKDIASVNKAITECVGSSRPPSVDMGSTFLTGFV